MKFSISVEYKNKFHEYPLPSVSNVEMRLNLSEVDCPYSIKLSAFDKQWKIKRDKDSTLYYNNQSEHSTQMVEEKILESSDIFKVFFPDESFAAIMVIELSENNMSFEKYKINNINRITVGKDERAIICVKYKFISSKHIEFVKNGDSYSIKTLKNSNAVFLNGSILNGTASLSKGDIINTIDFKIIFLGDILAINMKNNVSTGLEVLRTESYRYINRKYKIQPAFSRAPRDIEPIYCEPIVIEPPPNAQRMNEKPFIFTLGPAMTMPLPMLSSMLIRYSLNSNAGSNLSMYVGMIASIGLSAIIGCVWAVANQNYVKKNITIQEDNRIKRYTDYVLEKEKLITEKQRFNLQIFEKQYLSSEKLVSCLDNDKTLIWNRNKNHDDFLKIRLGTGIQKFSGDIIIPPDKFTLSDDMLSEGPKRLLNEYEYMKNIPKLLDLKKDKIIGIIGEKELIHRYAVNMIIQIASLYCYSDVRMAAFFNENEEKYYGWTKWLPHFASEDGDLRMIAENKESSQNILYSISHILSERHEILKNSRSVDEVAFEPHYVVFCTDESFFNGEIIEKYITSERKYGFTFILVYGDITKLYNQCISIVECCQQYNGMYFLNEAKNIENEVKFDELVSYDEADRFARNMSNMYVKEYKSAQMPSFIEYFEMMGINKIQDYDLIRAYKLHHVYENIKSFVGIGAGNRPMYIDICEKKYGPHGLVAGTTGSGKSETIQTFIISLALNYHPDELAFVLIDYKGGGMANIFKGIPHLAGTITNINGESDVPDANQMRRTLISIESEYKRRLEIFSKYGINHIDNYIRLYHDGKVNEPIPHLIIISDEFAELFHQQRDFIDKLVSISRVGRSVGIHLILATQKPSGVVSPEIRTNSRFKICLKVQDKSDSVEMLGRGEGATLKNKGQAYLQVGNDEVFEMFQTGYSGAKYSPSNGSSNSMKKEVRMINLDGTNAVIKKIKSKENKKVKCSIKAGYAVNCCINTDNAMIKNLSEHSVFVSRYKDGRSPVKIEGNNSQIIKDIGDCTGNEGNIYIFSKYDSEVIIEFINNDDSQLAVSVRYIINECRKNNIKWTRSLWLSALPKEITLSELRKKHEFKKSGNKIIAEIGMIDYPEKQMQYPAVMDFSSCTNLMIIGLSGCGKTTLLKTMLFSLVEHYTSDEFVFYIMDFSSRIFKSFLELPHCGGVAFEEDEDMILRLINMIENIISERQKLFGMENTGTFSEYIKKHRIPLIAIIIDNYAVFAEHFPKEFERMVKLFSNCVRYGIQFIVTANSDKDISSRIKRNINNCIALQLKERNEYRELYNNRPVSFMPSAAKGRGMFDAGDKILEFQSAVICSSDEENEYMKKVFSRIIGSGENHNQAETVPYIPEGEDYIEFFEKAYKENLMMPLGYDMETLRYSYIDLRKIYCYCITANSKESMQLFVRNIIFAGSEMNADIYYFNMLSEFDIPYENKVRKTARNTQQLNEIMNILIEEFKVRKKIKEDFEAKNPAKPYVEHIAANTQKIFVIIDNMAEFCKLVYENLSSENIEYRKIPGCIEAIFKNGRDRNMYFFAGFKHNSFTTDVTGKVAFRTFISDRTGINLGGCLDRQKIFNHISMPVAQQQKSEKYYIGNTFISAGDMRNVFIPHESE